MPKMCKMFIDRCDGCPDYQHPHCKKENKRIDDVDKCPIGRDLRRKPGPKPRREAYKAKYIEFPVSVAEGMQDLADQRGNTFKDEAVEAFEDHLEKHSDNASE